MTSPTTGLNAIVTALKAISTVVALLNGDPDRIVAYADGKEDLGAAVNGMDTPSLLVTYDHTEASAAGLGPFDNYYSIFVRSGSSTFVEFLTAIMNGEPAGDGVKFPYYTVDNDFDPPEFQRGGRENDADGHEFFRIVFVLRDRLYNE